MSEAPDIDAMAAELVKAIAAARLSLSDEKQTQTGVEKVLAAAGIPFEREKRLSTGEIVDFLVRDCIALEVKLKHAKPAQIMRQLVRYAKQDAVKALVLATNRAMGLPPAIGGKPAYFVSLGRAWL